MAPEARYYIGPLAGVFEDAEFSYFIGFLVAGGAYLLLQRRPVRFVA